MSTREEKNHYEYDELNDEQRKSFDVLSSCYNEIETMVNDYLQSKGLARKVGEMSFVTLDTPRPENVSVPTNGCCCRPSGTWVPYCYMCEKGY